MALTEKRPAFGLLVGSPRHVSLALVRGRSLKSLPVSPASPASESPTYTIDSPQVNGATDTFPVENLPEPTPPDSPLSRVLTAELAPTELLATSDLFALKKASVSTPVPALVLAPALAQALVVKVPRVPAATGILTTIPVTGERPVPERHLLLDDDVLYAIFLILYEKDPESAGMTVKQVCDVLVERHPEMATLLLKTLNLVLAKMNAYVKRVEKGERLLKYAMSRDWADALPKRMVYTYRGLLTKDFHVHAQAALEVQKREQEQSNPLLAVASKKSEIKRFKEEDEGRALLFVDLASELRDGTLLKVPYDVAPVAAAFAHLPRRGLVMRSQLPTDSDDDDLELGLSDVEVSRPPKRLQLMLAVAKRAKVLTAAAAAPRVLRQAATSADRALVLEAFSSTSANPTALLLQWLDVVRLGFMAERMPVPEDVLLDELESMFGDAS